MKLAEIRTCGAYFGHFGPVLLADRAKIGCLPAWVQKLTSKRGPPCDLPLERRISAFLGQFGRDHADLPANRPVFGPVGTDLLLNWPLTACWVAELARFCHFGAGAVAAVPLHPLFIAHLAGGASAKWPLTACLQCDLAQIGVIWGRCEDSHLKLHVRKRTLVTNLRGFHHFEGFSPVQGVLYCPAPSQRSQGTPRAWSSLHTLHETAFP